MHEGLCKTLHCIRENNSDHVIIHVSANELDSERQAEMIPKSIKKHKNKHPQSVYKG